MPLQLDDIELRVLGVLIEKSLTTPASYPLTMNAIVLGANQKQNRDPVAEFNQSDIARVLHRLTQRQLVKQAPPCAGARANRFEHNIVERLGWDRRVQAVMGELMLRGRQTAGELRSRASRMTPLHDLQIVGSILQEMAGADPPLVRELPREPGRSANRFEQMLGGEGASGSTATAVSVVDAVQVGAGQVGAVQHGAVGADAPNNLDSAGGGSTFDLAARVELLEQRVARLEEALARRVEDDSASGGATSVGPISGAETDGYR